MGTSLICIFLGSLFNAFILTDAASILVMTPFFSRSHFAFNNAMAMNLLNAGHQITVVTSLPRQVHHKNYSIIEISPSAANSNRTNHLPVSAALKMSTKMSMMDMLVDETERDCYNVMESQQMQEFLHSNAKPFDVMFVDLVPFMYECFLPIADSLDIPVVGTLATRSGRYIEWIAGNPYNPAVIPFELSHFSKRMSLIERSTNLWHCMVDHLYRHFYIYPRLNKFYERHFANLTQTQRRKPALVFVNGYSALLPRPMVPNVINVGGIHMPSMKPLPQELQKFIDDAKDGVILFTVGSTLQSHMMPNDVVAVFRDVFASIPQRVIWKSEETIDDISPNVLLSKWLPQRDILAHENVVAFITHCGISGIYEAIDSSTPMILIPVIFDEISNAALLEELGVGVRLNMLTLERKHLLQALNSVIYDTKYKRRMQEISLQVKDQPLSHQELVVYWTEYVLRYNGAKHLAAVAAEMPLYQYLLLDVLIFVMLIFMAVLWIVCRLTKSTSRFLANFIMEKIYVSKLKKNS